MARPALHARQVRWRCSWQQPEVAVAGTALNVSARATLASADPGAGTFSALPGAWEAAQCSTSEQRRQQQESQALSVQLLRWAGVDGFAVGLPARCICTMRALLGLSVLAMLAPQLGNLP